MFRYAKTMGLALFAVLLAFVPAANAVAIHGTIYLPTLEPTRALVTINTQPEQRMVALNGSYYFTAPPGNYTLTIQARLDTTPVEYHENITLTATQDTVLRDIILIGNTPGGDAIDLINELNSQPPEIAAPNPAFPFEIAGGLILLALAGGFYLYWARTRRGGSQEQAKGRQTTPGPAPAPAAKETSEEKEILKQISKSDGVITQKELRKRLPYSEARISMVLTTLEALGKIRKVKQGRGNIVRLKP